MTTMQSSATYKSGLRLLRNYVRHTTIPKQNVAAIRAELMKCDWSRPDRGNLPVPVEGCCMESVLNLVKICIPNRTIGNSKLIRMMYKALKV